MHVWYYFIKTGEFSRPFDDTPVFAGYSGRGAHRNNPFATHLRAEGPIPVGLYRALDPRSHPVLGPVAIPLEPHGKTETFKRSGFYIHGDNGRGYFSASEGCIIVQRSARIAVEPGDVIAVYP